MKETTDYYRIASEFYLSDTLPHDYLDMDDDDFHACLEQNAWEPFEYWSGDAINESIQDLSVAMENIARDTRKNTLDEVREALKLDDINL
ncbi:MAG: hypothetical protein ACPGII_10615 [Opitutales bacterium]